MIAATSFEHLTDGLARITPILLDGTLKGSAVLVAAWLIAARMRRSAAAARHMLWLGTLASLLVLPLLGRALPAWRVLPESWDVRQATIAQRPMEAARAEPVRALAPQAVAAANAFEPEANPPENSSTGGQTAGGTDAKTGLMHTPSVSAWIGLVWLAGTTLLLLRLLLGIACLLWAGWRLRACTDDDWQAALLGARRDLGIGRRVRLLQGRENAMPMTWGLFVPHLLVPGAACQWAPQRRRVVLLHELAHVKRWDCLTQLLAEVACAVQWFNPLAWLASKRMQNEAERACDDLVLARGSRPAEYAEHLLQIAASQHQGYLAAAMAAIPMARALKLEGRLLAILDGQRSRRAMTLGVFVLAAALVAGVVVPVAMLRGANKPADTQKDSPATASASEQAVARLPDGLTVEVAGVSYHPSEGRQWWGPDGTVGEQYAFVTPKNSVRGGNNTQTREFVVRLKGEGAEDAGLSWHNEPSTGGASGPAKPAKGTAEGVLQCLAAPLPAADKTATIRVNVASGPWMPLAEETAGGLTARDGTSRSSATIFSPAYESDGGAGISVSHYIILEGQVRIVAIGKDGREHTTRDVSSGSAGDICQTTAHFAKLPLKDVKSFRLEGRWYLWVKFRNVSLEPGYKTDVQVEVGPVAYVSDAVKKQEPKEFVTRGLYTTVVKAPGTAQSQEVSGIGSGIYTMGGTVAAATQPDVVKARQLGKRAVSAGNMQQILRGLSVCMPQKHWRWPEDRPWPEDLRQIVEKGLGKTYDESADYLSNPERPGMKPAYIYVKPPESINRIIKLGRQVVLYEAYDEWGGGINVGFLDGLVTFMNDQGEFEWLLSREYQKQREPYTDLGAPASAPAAALPALIAAPATQPVGEFYVMGAVRPGVYSLTGRKISLTQGVAAAGGLRPESKVVQLLRPDKDGVLGVVATYSVEASPWPQSPILQPNDVIYISEDPLGATQVIDIRGDVPRPGEYPLRAGTTLLKALVAAGLNSADAEHAHVRIQRTFTNGRAWMGSGFEVVRILRGEIPDEPLRPGDDIQVTVSKPAGPGTPAKTVTTLPTGSPATSQPQQGQAPNRQLRSYPLRYADAAETAAALSKLSESRFGKNGPQVVADTRDNSVIVAATGQQLAAIEEMIRLLDQRSERTAPVAHTRPAAGTQPDVDVEVVQIHSGNGEEIANRAQKILDGLFGESSPLVEAKASQSTIYITGGKEQRQDAVQIIRRLEQIAAGVAPDEPFRLQTSEGTEFRMIPMRRKDRDEIADQAQKMLDAIYGKRSPFVEAYDGHFSIIGRADQLDKVLEILGKLEANAPPGARLIVPRRRIQPADSQSGVQ